jgi:hypothetical protein
MALPSPAQLPEQPFEISLSIRHPTIDPDEISRTLDIQPIEAFRAGDPRPCGSGGMETRVHGDTYWVAVFSPDTWLAQSRVQFFPEEAMRALRRNLRLGGLGRLLEVRLATVCEHLRARQREFLQRLHAEGGRIALRVTLSPREVTSFTLPVAAGRALTELGIAIEFDLAAG